MDLQLKPLLTQIFGFLIVVWLLRKYAWQKLIDFTEKRRATIAAEFDNIEQMRAEADALKQKFNDELASIESTRRVRIQQAVSEANTLASDIKDEARQEGVALRAKANSDVALEFEKANVALRNSMADAVITVAEKVIRERLDDARHRQLIEDFLKDVKLNEGMR